MESSGANDRFKWDTTALLAPAGSPMIRPSGGGKPPRRSKMQIPELRAPRKTVRLRIRKPDAGRISRADHGQNGKESASLEQSCVEAQVNIRDFGLTRSSVQS